MISRATVLENLAVLRWFPSTNVDRRLSEAHQNEFERLQLLDELTLNLKHVNIDQLHIALQWLHYLNLEYMLLYIYIQVHTIQGARSARRAI
jgi:hypothetical protein